MKETQIVIAMRNSLLKEVVVIGTFVCIVFVFFYKVLIFRYIALPVNCCWDAVSPLYPFKLISALSWRDCEVPLWNPYMYCGIPLLANVQSGVFSLPDILFYLFPNPLGYSYMFILYMVLCGTFTYIFMRVLGTGRFGSLVSSIAVVFQGYCIEQLVYRIYLATLLWFPLSLAFLEKAITKQSYRYGILSGFALGALFLGGVAQDGLYLLAGWLTYAIFRSLHIYKVKKGEINKKTLSLIVIIALFIGFNIGAVQFLPTMELIPLSNRTLMAEQYSEYYYFSPKGGFLTFLITSFVPYFFGCGSDGVKMPPLPSWLNLPIIPFPRYYVGIYPFLLAIIASIFRRDWFSRFFTFIAISVILFLLAVSSPLKIVITHIMPGFNLVIHERALLVCFFSAAVLAGLGADYLIAKGDSIKAQIIKFNKIIASIWGFVALIFFSLTIFMYFLKDEIIETGRAYIDIHGANTSLHPHSLEYYYGKLNYYYLWFFEHLNVFKPTIGIPLLAGISSIGLLWAFVAWKRMKTPVFQMITILIIAADFLYVGMKFYPFTNPDYFYSETKITSFLREKQEMLRVLPCVMEKQPEHSGRLDQFEDPFEGSPRRVIMPNDIVYGGGVLMAYGIQNVVGFEAIWPRRYIDFKSAVKGETITDTEQLYWRNYNSRILDLLNVKYFLSKEDLPNKKFKLILIDGDVKVYENLNVIPRIFLVPKVKVMGEDDILTELQKEDFNPLEYVLLEETPQELMGASDSLLDSSAHIIKYSANEVIIETEMHGNGFLVISDTYYPGWKAYVDDIPKRIYRADYLIRSVYLTEGHHNVRFVYDPISFKLGASISLGTVICASIFLVSYSFGCRKTIKGEKR